MGDDRVDAAFGGDLRRLQFGHHAADVTLGAGSAREAADAVTIRTITAIEQTIPISHIALREKQQRSLMPDGLAAGLTVRELASVLDYLEQLSRGPK